MIKSIQWILISLLLVYATIGHTQQISNVDFNIKKNKMIVSYDLSEGQKNKIYDIKLIITAGQQTIKPTMVSGDVFRVSPGTRKEIIWDVLAEVSDLKGAVQVEVKIANTRSSKIVGGPSNVFLSMLLPGVGSKYVTQKSDSKWAYTSAMYLTSLYGIYYNYNEYNNYYDVYHNATTQEEMDVAYEDANKSYQIYQAWIGVAGTIWVADVIFVLVNGFKNRKEQRNNLSFSFSGTPNSFGVKLTKTF